MLCMLLVPDWLHWCMFAIHSSHSMLHIQAVPRRCVSQAVTVMSCISNSQTVPHLPLLAVQVYVRNLPFAATEQDIDHFFSQAGHVEDVRRGAGPDGAQSLWVPKSFLPCHAGVPCTCDRDPHSVLSKGVCWHQSARSGAEGQSTLSCLRCAGVSGCLCGCADGEAVLRR